VRENLSELKQRYFSSIKTIATVLIPIVLLQSGLAPFYVPLIFGTKWINAIPILSIICLSAIPLAFALGSYQLLNAVGHVKITLIWNSIYTALFAIVILVAVRWGIFSVAVAVLMCQAVTLIFSMWATRYVLASEAVRVSMD
jgi:O-antigen/teichoic acid export membrane protein